MFYGIVLIKDIICKIKSNLLVRNITNIVATRLIKTKSPDNCQGFQNMYQNRELDCKCCLDLVYIV